jgi:hypothetical protein
MTTSTLETKTCPVCNQSKSSDKYRPGYRTCTSCRAKTDRIKRQQKKLNQPQPQRPHPRSTKPDHELQKALTRLHSMGLNHYLALPAHTLHDRKALAKYAQSANRDEHETIWRFLTRT